MQDGDEDVRLMLALRDGDEAAFDALFARWSAPLLRYVERMVRDAASAEELVQESFLRLYRARDRYRPEARFSTWLYTIATRLALNELRRPHHQRPHQSADEVDDEGRSLVLASEEPRADDVAHARRVGESVEAALGDLPERQRAALWLSAVEGHSYAEIAAALSTTEKSVKALVHRARCTLALRLGAKAEA
ncbi:MAG: RNA polymerase subunit sigma-24 [Proteobacteria bacterium]|nr:MAG: RNA polymerase subunit sigma-24 [Pseudomonadota bacterium]